MDPTLNIYKYLASQCQLIQKEEPFESRSHGFVTISRQAGAGGITIGEKLTDYLNKELPGKCFWTLFDKNLVNQVIKEHNLSEKILPFLKESSISEIEDILDDLFGLHPPQFNLVQCTTETILHLAKMGRVILIGRGAPVITRKIEGGVHIRLIGSFQKRKSHIKEHFKLTDKEAERFIENEDRGRAQYLKKYFNEDIDNPLLYDLIINIDTISYDYAALLIGNMVVRKKNLENSLKRE